MIEFQKLALQIEIKIVQLIYKVLFVYEIIS